MQRGLGAIGKRDLNALLLHMFEKHLGWEIMSNQELSLRMRLTVPRVKSLRYEGALRFYQKHGSRVSHPVATRPPAGRVLGGEHDD